jgi:homoserine dehydrogenase
LISEKYAFTTGGLVRHFKLAFLGFGNVGKALARLFLDKQRELAKSFQISFSVTGVATSKHGAAIALDGLDLNQLIQSADLSRLNQGPVQNDFHAIDFIKNCQADVLFENTPVNYATGQPAVDHLRAALESGMHAITANKGPVVHAYRELTELARQKQRRFYFESTVMDGAPIFSLFRETLPGARLLSFRGILNSTTNLILTLIEQGKSFEEAVEYCQKTGIAETDPSGDIDGWDAAVKIAALSTVLMDIPLKPAQVDRQGIRGLTPSTVINALENGKRWKLVCSAKRSGQKVDARVAPELVDINSPLYNVNGTTSIIEFETDVLKSLSIVESDPGPATTAYGLFADFLNAVK